MYSCMNSYEGRPPRLYRSIEEISADINRISYEIQETEKMLSVDNVMLESIPRWAEESPEEWIPKLEEVIADADEGLERLLVLKDELELLKIEMENARCVLIR